MSQRRLPRTGVSRAPLRPLSADERKRLHQQLDAVGINASDEFYSALEQALGCYDADVDLKHRVSATATEEQLREVRDALNALGAPDGPVDRLDANAQQLLDETTDGGIEGFHRQLDTLIQSAGAAHARACEYPQRGRPLEDEKRRLGADVADAMRKYTDTEPTSTKEGAFQSVLQVVLQIATGQTVYRDKSGKEKETYAHIDQQVSRALKVKRVEHAGVRVESTGVRIEYPDSLVTYHRGSLLWFYGVVRVEVPGSMVEYIPPEE